MTGNTDMHLLVRDTFKKVGVWIIKPVSIWCDHRVCLSNLTRIKTSIPANIERDRDASHLKIGLLNVRSLTSKVVIVIELITDHNLNVIGLTEHGLSRINLLC